MKAWVYCIVLVAAFWLTSTAADQSLHKFELSMLNKLHKPLYKQDRTPPQYPRKGEYPCKEGICSNKKKFCEDCQYAKPLEFS